MKALRCPDCGYRFTPRRSTLVPRHTVAPKDGGHVCVGSGVRGVREKK